MIYEPRCSNWEGHDELDKDDTDGVLVGWKRETLQLVRSQVIKLYKAAEIAKTPALAVKAANRDNVAILANLVPFNRARLEAALVVCSFQLCGGHPGDAYEVNPDDEADITDRQSTALVNNWHDEEAVRLVQSRYLVKCIEKFNSDFQNPVVMGRPSASKRSRALSEAEGRSVSSGRGRRGAARPPEAP